MILPNSKESFLFKELEKNKGDVTLTDILSILDTFVDLHHNPKANPFIELQLLFPEYRKEIIDYLIEMKFYSWAIGITPKQLIDNKVVDTTIANSIKLSILHINDFSLYDYLNEIIELDELRLLSCQKIINEINTSNILYKELEKANSLVTDKRIKNIMNKVLTMEEDKTLTNDTIVLTARFLFRNKTYLLEYLKDEKFKSIMEKILNYAFIKYKNEITVSFNNIDNEDYEKIINFSLLNIDGSEDDIARRKIVEESFNSMSLSLRNDNHIKLFLNIAEKIEIRKLNKNKNILKFIKSSTMQRLLIEEGIITDPYVLGEYTCNFAYNLILENGTKPDELPKIRSKYININFIKKLHKMDKDIFKKRNDIVEAFLELSSYNCMSLYELDKDIFDKEYMDNFYKQNFVKGNFVVDFNNIFGSFLYYDYTKFIDFNKNFISEHPQYFIDLLRKFKFDTSSLKIIEYILDNDVYIRYIPKVKENSKIKHYSELSDLEKFDYLTYLLCVPQYIADNHTRQIMSDPEDNLMYRIKTVINHPTLSKYYNSNKFMIKYIMQFNLSK